MKERRKEAVGRKEGEGRKERRKPPFGIMATSILPDYERIRTSKRVQ